MNFSPTSAFSIVWALEMSIEATLLYMAWGSRKEKFRFIAYLGFHLAWSIAMFPLAMSQNAWLYFYCYWMGRALLFILESLCIGAILARILKPLTDISPRLTSVMFLVGSVLCAFGWFMSTKVTSHRALPITRLVLSAERGLTTMEAMAILFSIALVSVFAFRWTHTDAFLTAGFAFQALATMISAALFSFAPSRFSGLIQNGLQVTDLMTFGLWIAAFYPLTQQFSQSRVGILSRSAR